MSDIKMFTYFSLQIYLFIIQQDTGKFLLNVKQLFQKLIEPYSKFKYCLRAIHNVVKMD